MQCHPVLECKEPQPLASTPPPRNGANSSPEQPQQSGPVRKDVLLHWREAPEAPPAGSQLRVERSAGQLTVVVQQRRGVALWCTMIFVILAHACWLSLIPIILCGLFAVVGDRVLFFLVCGVLMALPLYLYANFIVFECIVHVAALALSGVMMRVRWVLGHGRWELKE